MDSFGMVKKRVMLNLENVNSLYKLTSNEFKILFELLKTHGNSNEDFILVNKYIREEIAKKINTTEGTVKNACTKFVKTNTLIKIATGVYKPNSDILQVVHIRKLEYDYDENLDELMARFKSFKNR